MTHLAHHVVHQGRDFYLGRNEDPETQLARAAYPVTAHPAYAVSTATSKYWWEGGAWLDQGQTGTCVGNAFAHRYADSPAPHGGIDEAWARQLYVDASGDTSLQQGTTGLAACRALTRRGQITAYHWVTSGDELRNTVLELGAVCIGITWFNSMFDPVAKFDNFYLNIDPSSGVAGAHELEINGINLQPKVGPAFYRLKNSWGRGWAHFGTTRAETTALEDHIFGRGGDAVIVSEA